VPAKIEVSGLNVYYGEFRALEELTLEIQANRITAFIGPSGCGKTTLLKSLDRMLDLVDGARVEGTVLLDGEDIYRPGQSLISLRKKVGMVFQRPNPFPLSCFDNVAYGPRVHGLHDRRALEAILERSLGAVHLWDTLKDHLRKPALSLSTEQQQRLCSARLLAGEPEVLLMDEPCSALDPIATMHVEELMAELKKLYTIVIVTHNMQQAARISDQSGFFYLGRLVEFNHTDILFTNPSDKRTEDYITAASDKGVRP
jgi:phosphate transport system ATP-binding protein